MSNKFKIGDTVIRRRDGNIKLAVGEVGVVSEVRTWNLLRLKGFGDWGFDTDTLELHYPNPPHKHAALIKAWADGAEIECMVTSSGLWIPCCPYPDWRADEYRIKPIVDNTKEIASVRVEMEKLAKRLKNLES